MNDKLSIIIPVYNLEGYISRCVDSLLNQNYENIEVILVDDGSTDGTWKLLQELAQKDQRLVVLHQVNGKTARARNNGLKHATGKYVTFVDGDDTVSKDAFQQNISFLQSNPMLDWVSFSVVRVNEELKVLNNSKTYNHFLITKDEYVEKNDFLRKFYFKGLSGLCCGTIYRMDAVRNIRFLEGEYYEDSLYFCEALCCTRLGLLSSVGQYLYLERENSSQFAYLDSAHLRSDYIITGRILKNYTVSYPNDIDIIQNIEDDYYYTFKLRASKLLDQADLYFEKIKCNFNVPHRRRWFVELKLFTYKFIGYSRLKSVFEIYLRIMEKCVCRFLHKK